MKMALVLLVMCASGVATAEECDELCKPPPPTLDPHVRDEILTGLALTAIGHSIGALAQLTAAEHGPAEKALATIPVFGAIEGAARSGDNWQLRMTLVFSVGVQVVGVLLMSTAWAARNEKRVGVSGDGVLVHF
jgi:hypothetical protein